MATLVASVTATPGASGGATAAINTTGANLIVIGVAYYISTPTITDSKGNTYTALTARISSNFGYRFFYTLAPTVGTGHTFSATASNFYPAIFVYAFSGVLSYHSESGAATASGTSLASGSVTPSADGALIISGLSSNGASGSLAPSGFTVTVTPSVGGVNIEGGVGYQNQTTAAAINPTWTFPTNEAAVATAVFLSDPAASAAAAIRVTQAVVEILGAVPLATEIHVTQDAVELLHAPVAPARVTQYLVEVLGEATAAPPPKDYTWQITDMPDVDRWMTGLVVFPVGDAVPAPPPDPPDAPTASPTHVVIPMHVTTRVVFPSGVDAWGADCLCDE